MKRGEIRWYKFHAPDKKRPVLILTRDSVLEYIAEATIAPITTTLKHKPRIINLRVFIPNLPRSPVLGCFAFVLSIRQFVIVALCGILGKILDEFPIVAFGIIKVQALAMRMCVRRSRLPVTG